jgi:RHS repeat-associated protein
MFRINCSQRNLDITLSPGFEILQELTQIDEDEGDIYYYHGDHLGSSSWISNASGNVDQHLAYMPFGEDFINERHESDIRFKFTGKERDTETGFSYFGARYYNPEFSFWLSVDRMADRGDTLRQVQLHRNAAGVQQTVQWFNQCASPYLYLSPIGERATAGMI